MEFPRRYWLPLLLALFLTVVFRLFWHPGYEGTPVVGPPPLKSRILLAPLDSRPPCLDFVVRGGRIAGVEVITPPEEILDYYSKPGDTTALQAWVRENLAGCSYAILSIDQLLHGGLLASREAKKTPEDAAELIHFLTDLHARYPETPLYAFNILPRLAPPDSIDGADERKNLMRWSRLADRLDLEGDNAAGRAELRALEMAIPSNRFRHYTDLFTRNTQLNEALLDLVDQGVLSWLVIGQDDGEVYGINNRERRRLQESLANRQLPASRAFFTHGADEIALTILAAAEARRSGYTPHFSIEYSDDSIPDKVLPYMAASMRTTAEEKTQLLGGLAVAPQEADITLFLASHGARTMDRRQEAAHQVQALITAGRRIALADMAEDFRAEETILPQLLRQHVPLHALAAYAGWNTASNAIGTAAAQAVLIQTAQHRAADRSEALAAHAENLAFLDGRFLEDYYYLKDVIDLENAMLRKAGYFDVNDLDLDHNARWVNDTIQKAMDRRLASFSASRAFRSPVALPVFEGSAKLAVQKLAADVYCPWPRTFEVRLTPTAQVVELKQ